MKFSPWTSICFLFFIFYASWLKENIFSVYFVSSIHRYRFNETIKVTICSPLNLFEDWCAKSGLTVPKLDAFNCDDLRSYPLNCLTRGLENKRADSIIKTLRRCDPSLIFGSNLLLVKYNRTVHSDFAINQFPLNNYSYDYNFTYLNNGDYCATFVFETFVRDALDEKEIMKKVPSVVYQFVLEKMHSPIKVFVNQDQTNLTYFSYYQSQHRYKDEDFWARRNEDIESVFPSYLGLKNVTVTDSPLGDANDSSNDTSQNATRNGTEGNRVIQMTTMCIPAQNMTVYTLVMHTRVIYLGFPYETGCLEYRRIHQKVVKTKEMCLMECYKSRHNFHKFLYTDKEKKTLQEKAEIFPECEAFCRPPNCRSDLFFVQKIANTFNTGDEEVDNLIRKPKIECRPGQNVTFNYRMKIQLNEWMAIMEAKPAITPILAINYVFGLLNVFLGTNLMHFNYKLIHVLVKLRRLTFGSTCKRRTRPDSSVGRPPARSGDWNLMLAQQILKKKFQKFSLTNRPQGRSLLQEKLKRLKSLIGNLGYVQLVNFNRLFCFYLLISLSVVFAGEYLENMQKEPQALYTNLERAFFDDPISVSFCFDLREIVPSDIQKNIYQNIVNKPTKAYADRNYSNPNTSKHEEHMLKIRLRDQYLNLFYHIYSLSQIDEITLSVKDLLQSVYLGFKEYGFESNQAKKSDARTIYDLYSLNPVVFYFRGSKCVKLFINRTDFLYVYEHERSFALFDFKVAYEKYYIEQDDQLPNKQSTAFGGWIEFQLKKRLNDSSSCMNFALHESCKSKGDCESQCIQANYTGQHKAISVNHPIIVSDLNRQFHFHSKTISTKNEKHLGCNLTFERPCKDFQFYKFTSGPWPPKEVMINLSNEINKQRAVTRFRRIDFLNFILNIGSLTFNVNVTTTIDFLILFVLLIFAKLSECFRQSLFRSRRTLSGKRSRKTGLLVKLVLKKFLNLLKIVILFCGFFVHFFYALGVNLFAGELRSSTYMSSPNRVKVPNFTICIGNEFVSYLSDSQTQKDYLSKKGVFTNKTAEELIPQFPSMTQTLLQIEFHDKNFNKINLNETEIFELESTGNFQDMLYLSTFFLEQSMCSTFNLRIVYSSLLFRLYDVKYQIRFNFRKLNKTAFHYTLFISDRNRFTFRNPIPLREEQEFFLFFDLTKNLYDDELLVRNYLIKLFTKNSVSGFANQAEYFEHLRSEFKTAKGLATTAIPLPANYFNLQINEKEFQEFYKTKFQSHEEDVFISETAHRSYRTMVVFLDSNGTRVNIVPQFLQQTTNYSNDQSIAQTFLYIGTILSFWLNTCLIGFPAYIRSLFRSCKSCCVR